MSSHIGTTIGDFEVLGLIGQGGMSFVYLVLDKELERHVALKIPRGRFLEDPSFVDRFKREARAMARLRHPGIVQIYTVGSHGETPYFAMEYVQSESLEKVVEKNGPLGIEVSLKYITQVARALGYAHKKGVVHRDIKPANILVDSSGRLLLTDFGVSKLISEGSAKETIGFLGTPQYMSPEQCGQGTLDHRTDIYSLGAVLFEMLTGKPAFSSSSPAEVIKKQLFDMPEFPAEFKEDIPESLQTLVAKMLAKDPDERYPNIPALLRDIEKLDRIDAGSQESAASSSSSANTITIENPTAASMEGSVKEVMRPGKRSRRAGLVLATTCLFFVLAMISLAATINLWSGRTDAGLPFSERVERVGEKALALLSSAKKAVPEDEQAWSSFPSEAAAPPSGHSEAVAATMSGPAPLSGHEGPGEPEPQPTKPQIQLTTMVITSNPPGAAVVLDSEHRGITPLTLSDVTPGSCMLIVKLKGYPDYILETSVEENDSMTMEISHDFVAAKEALIPKGSLTIDSDPPGAAVYVNGENNGKTPIELPDLRSADYTVSLQLVGYEPAKKQITLLPDENLHISLSLVEVPKFGSLSISSRPDGAEILLDGEPRGITPLALGKVPVGQYDVVLKKKGYKPYGARLTCKKDSSGTIEADLEMTPKFAARASMVEGDGHANMGDLEQAAEKYEQAISLDPENSSYRNKLKLARRSLIRKEVKNLLSSYKVAYDSENTELLASLLDESDPGFLSDQIADARGLFREFDNIELALSRPKVSLAGSGTVSVSLHLNMSADFRETGSSAELLNADRKLTLRRNPGGAWKICSIE